MKKYSVFTAALIAASVSLAFTLSYAQEQPLLVKSRYFSVYGPSGLDKDALLSKLSFNHFIHLDSLAGGYAQDLDSLLAQTLDAIYLEISDILDIHIYSFHGDIDILPDQDSLASLFSKFFSANFRERSFYLPERNTIYISYPDLTLGMLGHEIAHAIMAHYFVVLPPAKVQEILSGYVEYNLRKSTATLP